MSAAGNRLGVTLLLHVGPGLKAPMGHSLRNAPRLVQVELWTSGSDVAQESLGRFVPKIYRRKLLDSCAVGTSAGVEAYSVPVDISSHQQETDIPF
jgi:hypothetical protein